MCSITTFYLSLTVKKLLSFSFWLGFAYKGRNFGVLGAGDPQNLICGDCNPQKAHMCVISSLLSAYTLKSVHGFGQAAFPRKKEKKKSHTTGIFRQISPRHGGAIGYSNGVKFCSLVAPADLITPANFDLGQLRTGCVALHESLLSF